MGEGEIESEIGGLMWLAETLGVSLDEAYAALRELRMAKMLERSLASGIDSTRPR